MIKNVPKNNALKPIIAAKNLSKFFGAVEIFSEVSFEITPGEIVAIIGPNGSGKSTLARILLGLELPSSGTIEIAGKKPKFAKDLLGYVPQRFAIDRTFPITVSEFLSLVECTHCHTGKEYDTTDILKKLGVYNTRNQMLGTLSGGQLQRVLIARAIIHQRSIIVLDEPSSSIDIQGEKELYALIQKVNKDLGITFIVISHEMNFVYEFASQVLCINKRLLCAGKPHAVLTPEHLEEIFGSHMHHFDHTHT